jgi:hypothetical protein
VHLRRFATVVGAVELSSSIGGRDDVVPMAIWQGERDL